MDSCRCKFRCTAVETYEHSTKLYTFNCTYDPSIEEDRRFAKASPSGELKIYIDNPSAQAFFEVGRFYYFDASACDSVGEHTQEKPAEKLNYIPGRGM